MRARDYVGFPLLAIGISGVMLGHHWFGQIWFWGGFVIVAIAISIMASGGLQGKIERALRSHRGPGDGGSTDYHSGRSATERDWAGGDADGD